MANFEQALAKKPGLLYLLLACLFTLVNLAFLNTGGICDEMIHYQEAFNFSNGHFELLSISNIPGFHAIIALLFKVTGIQSFLFARIINSLFGLLAVIVFFQLCQRINPSSSVNRTLQFLLFPIIFVFHFIIYTDSLSLLFVLLMFLSYIDKRYAMSGMWAILSMLVRQNNVLWVAMIPFLIHLESGNQVIAISNLVETIKKCWSHVVGILLFVVFVYFNGGVAVGDTTCHPMFFFTTGNPFFFLFCAFILFLPMHVANIPAVWKKMKSGLLPIGITLGLFLLYWFTYEAKHPYNNVSVYYFIRNTILLKSTSSESMKLLFFLPVCYAFWSMAITPLYASKWNWIYVFTLLFLLPSWLIEQRYYMIPFALFILLRKDLPLIVERITIFYYVIILILLIPLITSLTIFL